MNPDDLFEMTMRRARIRSAALELALDQLGHSAPSPRDEVIADLVADLDR